MKFITTGELPVSIPKPKKQRDGKRRCYRCKKPEDHVVLIFSENPYDSEIHDDHSKHWYCQECLDDSMCRYFT